MTTGQQIVDAARQYIGTPFHHQGRVKGHGVDCAGMIVLPLKDIGIDVYDVPGYSRMPHGVLEPLLAKYCDKVIIAKPGDIYLFKILKQPQHLAIATDYGMIHAWQPAGKVIETRFDKRWQKRLVGIYRLKGILNE